MKIFNLIGLLLSSSLLFAQSAPFSIADNHTDLPAGEIKVDKAHYAALDNAVDLAELLAQAQNGVEIKLPDPEGQPVTFRLFRYQMIRPGLQAKYPDFVTLFGWDVDNPGRQIRAEWTILGFGAQVVGGKEGRWFVSPVKRGARRLHQTYYAADVVRPTGNDFSCDLSVNEDFLAELRAATSTARVGDCALREYDLALACTAEYFNVIAGIAETDTPSPSDTATVIAEMMTAINRVNQLTSRDLALQMTIINLPTADDGIQLIYAGDTLADPYTNSNGSAMLDENQENVDAIIGSAGYDIGHVFSTGGGGIAVLDSPCADDVKAHGVTGLPNPVGDPFYVDFVAHEVGHQLGGTHTFNSTDRACAERESTTAYEPGGGTTIQAYAGICGVTANIQLNSDPYYHAASIQQISAYMELGFGSSCATINEVSGRLNTAPEVSVPAGETYVIPTNTPFILEADAADGDGDALLYCWEQFDLGPVENGPPTGFQTNGPLFRSLEPVAESFRYFPKLSDVVAGVSDPWEVLPRIARDMNFIVTVRDIGAAGYGCTVQSTLPVTVVSTGSNYEVTSPNGGEVWVAGDMVDVTWDVGGTDGNGINCTDIELFLSTDGGQSFPTSLGVYPNTGMASVTAPVVTETDARIMARCDGNIFYDISDGAFRIEQTDFALTGNEVFASTCAGGDPLTGYDVLVEALQGYTGTVDLSLDNLPIGVSGTVNPSSITFTGGGSVAEMVTVTLNGVSGLADGEYLFNLQASDGGIPKDIELTLEVAGDFALLSPTDGLVIDDDENGNTILPVSYTPLGGDETYTISIEGFTDFNLGTANNINLNLGMQAEGTTRDIFLTASTGERTCVVSVTFGSAISSEQSLTVSGSPISICEATTSDDSYVIGFREGELTGPVELVATNVPAGLTVNFSETTLEDGGAAIITIDGEETLAPGLYDVEVTVTDAAMVSEVVTLSIEVEEDAVPILQPREFDAEVLLNPNAGCPGGSFIRITFEIGDYTGAGTPARYEVNPRVGNGFFPPIDITPNQPVFGNYCADDGDVISYVVTVFDAADNVLGTTCIRTVTAVNVLPVSWRTFDARPAGKAVALDWEVEQDEAHAGFAVERQTPDASTWEELGWVDRAGNSGTQRYAYTDVSVASGTTYFYRLRQEDVDGSFDYSPIRTVRLTDERAGLTVYPNPVLDVVFLRVPAGAVSALTGAGNGDPVLSYRVVDQLGKIVRTGRLTGGTAEVPLSDLPSAIYQIVVTDGRDYREQRRIVKR